MADENIPFQKIIKRDGRVLPFHAQKITQAIFKAAKAVGGEDYSLAEELTREVISYLCVQNLPGLSPTVEEIQDAVEKVLIEKGHARTAKAYILYRAKRTRIREAKSELMEVVKDILVEGNRAGNEEDRCSPAQKIKKVALAASQTYYLNNLLPQDLAESYQKGSFHIHQLGFYSKAIDSLQVDLTSFFEKDSIVNRKCFSSPADFPTALFVIAALIQKVGKDIHGEQALARFDTFLGNLFRDFDKRGGNNLFMAALEAFLCHLNLLSCSGHNFKFSLGLGLDTTEEGRAITRFFLEELLRGKKKYQRLPKIIFSLKEGVNLSEKDLNYDLYHLAQKAALLCGNPSFLGLNTSYNNFLEADSSYFSNGLRVVANKHAAGGGKRRGNIASLTINLPRLALSAPGQDLFFVELDRLLRLGVRQLLHRFEVLTALKCKELPTIMGWKLYLGSESLSAEDSIGEAIKNGLMSINFIGLPEAVRILLGDRCDDVAERFDLVKKIVDHMVRRVQSFVGEYGLNFALSGLSANGELKRLASLDKKDFGLMKGVTDKGFYNSSFILFQEDGGLEEKIALEGELHKLCSGGYASKIVLSARTDPRTIGTLFHKLLEAGVGYFSVTTWP